MIGHINVYTIFFLSVFFIYNRLPLNSIPISGWVFYGHGNKITHISYFSWSSTEWLILMLNIKKKKNVETSIRADLGRVKTTWHTRGMTENSIILKKICGLHLCMLNAYMLFQYIFFFLNHTRLLLHE